MSNRSTARGFASEDRVAEALEMLRSKGKPICGSPIKTVTRSARNSPLDAQKIDFLIEFENGTEIPLQVKSSKTACQHFEQNETIQKKRLISAVYVHTRDVLGQIINRLIQSIKLTFTKLQRKVEQIKARRPGKKYQRYIQRHPACMCH